MSRTTDHAASAAIGWHIADRIHRIAEHIHDLGPRAVGEALIAEAGASGDPMTTLRRLAPFTRFTRQQVVAAGADCPLRPRLKVAP